MISEARWLAVTTITLTTLSAAISISISAYIFNRKCNALKSKIHELELSLKSCSDNCASERQGRIRAQQMLRKQLTQPKSENLNLTYYPMIPIGTIHSCFSTRNGTPRQPLLHPSQSGFKAKVRVPRLKGGKIGVFGTRSPHRPCPIGLTVAKVEAVQGNMILLSGVDLVDGTPVLDVKPYLPYCDSIQEAAVPNWLMEDNLLSVASVSFSEEFISSLESCWITAEKKSLYASPGEFQSLVMQVLSWDIRSLSQRNRPRDAIRKKEKGQLLCDTSDVDDEHLGETAIVHEREQNSLNSMEVVYHLILEGLDVSYRIDHDGNVIVEKVSTSAVLDNKLDSYNYLTWKDKLQ
ncbi:putative TsaA-like domain-containing protein [Medicago truncatula]|uniref:Putative TsaA-like domain-containing protein n=1 Tax=Medicago truncatula TaxID=3880 RepID=A0A396ILQ0_MEDTR|nr:putative TsaA-like domain-containing protein [Medicago truncatula]